MTSADPAAGGGRFAVNHYAAKRVTRARTRSGLALTLLTYISELSRHETLAAARQNARTARHLLESVSEALEPVYRQSAMPKNLEPRRQSLVHTRPEVNRMPPQNRSRICCCRRSNAARISSNCCSRSAGFDWRTRSNIQICTPSTAGAPHDPHVQPARVQLDAHPFNAACPAPADPGIRRCDLAQPIIGRSVCLCRHGLGPVGPRLSRLTDPRLSDPPHGEPDDSPERR